MYECVLHWCWFECVEITAQNHVTVNHQCCSTIHLCQMHLNIYIYIYIYIYIVSFYTISRYFDINLIYFHINLCQIQECFIDFFYDCRFNLFFNSELFHWMNSSTYITTRKSKQHDPVIEMMNHFIYWVRRILWDKYKGLFSQSMILAIILFKITKTKFLSLFVKFSFKISVVFQFYI